MSKRTTKTPLQEGWCWGLRPGHVVPFVVQHEKETHGELFAGPLPEPQ